MGLATSAIARRFEDGFAETLARDLPCLLDSFFTVSRSFPKHIPDPVIVKVSHDTRSHYVELTRGTVGESINCSFHVNLQQPFQLRFGGTKWKDRPLSVQSILFRMSPIDTTAVSSLLKSSPKDQVSIEHERRHLVESAIEIISKVCDGVRFDDVATVTGMLAEAVLRVVRPLTAGLKLEQICLSVVIGDDPVTLTKTVSLTDLDARARTPQLYVPSLDHVSFPSGSRSSAVHRLKRSSK